LVAAIGAHGQKVEANDGGAGASEVTMVNANEHMVVRGCCIVVVVVFQLLVLVGGQTLMLVG
jgi:hypothetical protein